MQINAFFKKKGQTIFSAGFLFSGNKLIIDTRTEILQLRQMRVLSTKDSSMTLESKHVKKAK